jgi:hypothetical protein
MRSRGLISFLCRKTEAWSMEGLPLQETTTGKLTLRSSAILSDGQRQQFQAILQAKDPWLVKIDRLGALQAALHFPLVCAYAEQTTLKEVEAKFGHSDRHQSGRIYRDLAGTWYVYGSVRLGVGRSGRVLLVEVNISAWREEYQAVHESR